MQHTLQKITIFTVGRTLKKKKKEHASRKPDKSPEQTVHKEINSSYKEMLD